MHSGGFASFVSPEGTASHRGKRYNHKMFSEPRSHKRKEPSGGHLERGSARSHLPFFKSAPDDSTSISSMSSDVIGSDDGAFYTSPLVHSNSAGRLLFHQLSTISSIYLAHLQSSSSEVVSFAP